METKPDTDLENFENEIHAVEDKYGLRLKACNHCCGVIQIHDQAGLRGYLSEDQ